IGLESEDLFVLVRVTSGSFLFFANGTIHETTRTKHETRYHEIDFAKLRATMEFYKPYKEDHVNFIYNLLFCDDLTLWKSTTKGSGLWPTLLAETPDLKALEKIAKDE